MNQIQSIHVNIAATNKEMEEMDAKLSKRISYSIE